MKHAPLPLITAMLILISAACNKDKDGGGPPAPTTSSSLRDLFSSHIAQVTQTFTVNATIGGTITGTQGTRVTFPANGFRDESGALVSGTVQVNLLEALSIGDMIWINTQTVGDDFGTDRLLRSGGELRVTATQNGADLQLGPSGMSVMVPTEEPDDYMRLFTANTPTDSGMVWTPVDSSMINTVTDTALGGTPYFYEFTTDSLQWINCDYFYGYPNTTGLMASIPSGQPHDSTMVWIAFPSENAVMNMYFTDSQTYSSWQVVPVGMSATVVGLYRNGSQYYSAFNAVSITNAMNVPLTFTPTTLSQFQQAIGGI